MKKIDINVILTFCSYKEYGSQEIFDVSLSYSRKDKSARKLLDQSGFFDMLVKICHECERLPTELIKISTAADWTRKGFEFDIENGKWSFGSWRGQNIEWSDNLVKLHGFGKNDNGEELDLTLKSLFKYFSEEQAVAYIEKLMSN
jgi:hypothetical protein